MLFFLLKIHKGLLSERYPSEKAIYCMIPIIRHYGKLKTLETKKICDFQEFPVREDSQVQHRDF